MELTTPRAENEKNRENCSETVFGNNHQPAFLSRETVGSVMVDDVHGSPIHTPPRPEYYFYQSPDSHSPGWCKMRYQEAYQCGYGDAEEGQKA